jgi:hypothetical protein
MFEALEERVGVIPDEHTLRFGDYTIPMILPKVEVVDGQPQYPTSGNFVCGTKIHKGKPKRVELSLEAILAELRDLDSQATIASKNLPAQVKAAATNNSFSLAQLVNDGQVDELCSHLEQSPIEFGLQLHQLFEKDRACFEYFIRQRLLHRWLRATYGGDKTFAQLFSKMAGDNMTRDHVHSIFKSQELFQNLETIDTNIDGDEFSLHRGDLEEVLAVAEVLLAVHAPMYYKCDAAILASTKYPVTALASHLGSRCLSSVSLSAILLDTNFGLTIWSIMEKMYAGTDESSRHTLSTILAFYEAGALESTFDSQVMFKPNSVMLKLGEVMDLTSVAHRG